MRIILKTDEILAGFEKKAVVLLIFLMVFFSFLQVVLRLFFHSGIIWMDPFLRHMVLWSGLLGAALAAYESKHFALDIAHKIVPAKMERISRITVDLFSMLVSAVLFWASVKFLKDESAAGSVAFHMGRTGVKAVYAEFILPLSFFLISFHFFANIFKKGKGGVER